MERKSEQEEKIYRSITEIEKEFFPKSYKERIKEGKSKKPGTFGSNLAMEFLEDVRRKLAN